MLSSQSNLMLISNSLLYDVLETVDIGAPTSLNIHRVATSAISEPYCALS